MTASESDRTPSAAYPQEQKLDIETIRRWRSEAITTSLQERLWLNRCEALCNALLNVSPPEPSDV